MRTIFLSCFACLAGLLSGCLVTTPTHHLPQGYSESYRRILLQKNSTAVGHDIDHSEISPALTLPAIPIEPSPSHEFESVEDAEIDDLLPPGPEPASSSTP